MTFIISSFTMFKYFMLLIIELAIVIFSIPLIPFDYAAYEAAEYLYKKDKPQYYNGNDTTVLQALYFSKNLS